MPGHQPRIMVTGAGGKLGGLVIERLKKLLPPSTISAIVRKKEDADRLGSTGVNVRIADYTKPETLDIAFKDVDRLLLISSSELGQRVAQHRNVIAAASKAGIGLIAYTSALHADKSPLDVEEHLRTEEDLRAAGVPFVLLRNGWYTENHLAAIPVALARGAIIGSAGNGQFASAPRADYAEAAARVLTSQDSQDARVYELAGDEAYTLGELAAEISRQSGKSVVYHDLPEAAFISALTAAGVPPPVAALLANADSGAAQGGLFDDGRQLSALIGRPTAPLATMVSSALHHEDIPSSVQERKNNAETV